MTQDCRRQGSCCLRSQAWPAPTGGEIVLCRIAGMWGCVAGLSVGAELRVWAARTALLIARVFWFFTRWPVIDFAGEIRARLMGEELCNVNRILIA